MFPCVSNEILWYYLSSYAFYIHIILFSQILTIKAGFLLEIKDSYLLSKEFKYNWQGLLIVFNNDVPATEALWFTQVYFKC